jgi:D-glycero-alpha-D-manno-heptose-7-phosphate kinase
MIISRTPYRMSFFGGGTDYPTWFHEHGGAVLTTSIDRYCYINCRFMPPFFDHRSRIVWSKIELVSDHAEIDHPVIRTAMLDMGIEEGVEIQHSGDLPARSGLGSSSAFTVGLLNALHALRGDMVSKEVLAHQAIRVEQELLKENVGVQDQIQTAFGGFNRIDILPNGRFEVRPIVLSADRVKSLQDHLLLFYTGVSRHSSEVAGAQIRAIPNKQQELRAMRLMVDTAQDLLTGSGDIADFGRLLHEAWEIKRSLSDKIAPRFINEIYQRGRAAGAIGGKLLGAGGGGFLMLFVRPEDHVRVLQALSELLVIPIEFEHAGTQIIFYDPPRYSRTAHHRHDYLRYLSNGDGGGTAGIAAGGPQKFQSRGKSLSGPDEEAYVTVDLQDPVAR